MCIFFYICIRGNIYLLKYFETNLDNKATRRKLHKCNTHFLKVECNILFNNPNLSVSKQGGGKQALSSGYKETKLLSKIQVILSCLHNTYDMGKDLWSIRLVSRQLHLVFQKIIDLLSQSSNIFVYISGLCFASSYPPDISRALSQILQMLSTKNNCWHLQVACTNHIQNRSFYIHLFVFYIFYKPWFQLLKNNHHNPVSNTFHSCIKTNKLSYYNWNILTLIYYVGFWVAFLKNY